MPASEQPTSTPSLKLTRTSTLANDPYQPSSQSNLETRENIIRNTARKWFGPVELVDPKARLAELTRQDATIHTLIRLHRLSCNLVPEHLRVPIQEQDIFSAIIVLNRIAITLRTPAIVLVSYCEARAIREKNLRVNQLDPLQIRHLLTYHHDIPHEELGSTDIQALRSACEKADTKAIQTWFETIARRKDLLPLDAMQFLRQQAMDLWNDGHHNFLEIYATELAVLDCALFDTLGWETSRLFLAIFKRLHGSTCRSLSTFLAEADIALAIELYKHLGESDQTVHFRALSTAYDSQKFRRLERTIIAASKENGTRIRTETGPSPLEKKRAVKLPPAYASPEYYAQHTHHPIVWG